MDECNINGLSGGKQTGTLNNQPLIRNLHKEFGTWEVIHGDGNRHISYLADQVTKWP